MSGIDHELVGWEDPDAPYEKHSAIYDLAGLESESVFSVIQHWAPSSKDFSYSSSCSVRSLLVHVGGN